MSLAKQIIIGVLATITLGLFGVGSYYASTTLFPEPASSGSVTPTPSTASAIPSVGDMKKLEPQSVEVVTEGEEIEISFTTGEEVGSMVYVTPSKTEKIAQAMKDHNNGVAIAGSWYTVNAEADKSVTHSLKIPKDSLDGTTYYYYIVLSYKKYWLPYGSSTDYLSGVAEPYTFKL